MEVNTIRLVGIPPADASPVARTSAPTSQVRTAAAGDVENSPVFEDRPPSPAAEVLQQRRLSNAVDGIRLQVDQSVDRVIAQIVNESNEVIKQIPPEQAVRAFARFREVTGLLFDLEI